MGFLGSLLGGLGNAAGGLLSGAGNLLTQTVPKLLTNIPQLGSSLLSGIGNLIGGGGSSGGGGGGGFSLPNLLGGIGQAGSSLLGTSGGGGGLNNLLGLGLQLGGALRKDEPGEVGEARQFLRNQFTSPNATGDRLKEQVGGVQNAYGSYLQPNSTARTYLQSQFSDPNALASQFTGNVNALKGQFQPVLDQQRQRDIADIQQRFAAAFPGSVGAQGPEFGTLSRYITDEALPREQALLGNLGLDQLTRQQQAATQSLAADESQRNFVGQQAQNLTQNQQNAAENILKTNQPDKLNEIMSLLGANLLNGGAGGALGSAGGGVPGYGQPGYAGEGYANYPELYNQLYGGGGQAQAGGGGGLGGLLSGLLGGGGGLLSGAGGALSSLLSGGGLTGALSSLLGGGAQGATGLLSQLGLGGAPAGAVGGGIFGGGGAGSALSGVGGSALGALGAGVGSFMLGKQIGASIGSNSFQSGAAGAAAGAATGAAIGSIVPGIGTAIGALIGGIAGGGGGLFGRSSAVKAQKEASIAAETASTNARRPAAMQTAGELFNAANEFQSMYTSTKPKIIGTVENLYYNVGDPEIKAIFQEVRDHPQVGTPHKQNVDSMMEGLNFLATKGGVYNPAHASNPESQMGYLGSWELGKFDEAAGRNMTATRDMMQVGYTLWDRLITRLNELGAV